MKKAVGIFLGVLSLCLSSCNKKNDLKDPCGDIVCGQGVCVDGNCNCDDGYDKDNNGSCIISWASNFTGIDLPAKDTFKPGSFSNGEFTYAVTIVADNERQISVTNLSGFGSTVVIMVDSASNVTVDHTDADGRIFRGTGVLDNQVLTLDITIIYPNGGGEFVDTTITYS